MSAVVRIPTALIPAVALTIAGLINYAVTGGRIGAGLVALGVVWIMRAVRSHAQSEPQSRSNGPIDGDTPRR
jgi:hypothetical protein